jgi:drug/metabolite transporter (DMT)-like permease
VALLALRFDAEERATGARLAGLLLGLAGVVALMGIDVAGRTEELLGALAILFSAFCYAVGPTSSPTWRRSWPSRSASRCSARASARERSPACYSSSPAPGSPPTAASRPAWRPWSRAYAAAAG